MTKQTQTNSNALGTQIFGEMTIAQRATFDRDAWRDGVSMMCVDGEDADAVLDRIEDLLEADAVTSAARYVYSQMDAEEIEGYTRDAWIHEVANATRHLDVVSDDVCEALEAMITAEQE